MRVLDFHHATGTITIELTGACTAASRRQILDDVAAVVSLSSVREIVLSMSGVTGFDASALDAVRAAQRICRSQGKHLSVADAPVAVRKYLQLVMAPDLLG